MENKPEAPWVKRDKQQYVFTDQVYSDTNLNLNTEEDDKRESKKRFADEIKLDHKIEEKLKKIIK